MAQPPQSKSPKPNPTHVVNVDEAERARWHALYYARWAPTIVQTAPAQERSMANEAARPTSDGGRMQMEFLNDRGRAPIPRPAATVGTLLTLPTTTEPGSPAYRAPAPPLYGPPPSLLLSEWPQPTYPANASAGQTRRAPAPPLAMVQAPLLLPLSELRYPYSAALAGTDPLRGVTGFMTPLTEYRPALAPLIGGFHQPAPAFRNEIPLPCGGFVRLPPQPAVHYGPRVVPA